MFRIESDRARFREIVRGRVRKDLRKYLSTGELIGRAGEKAVSIPLPQIELPRFIFGEINRRYAELLKAEFTSPGLDLRGEVEHCLRIFCRFFWHG